VDATVIKRSVTWLACDTDTFRTLLQPSSGILML